MDICAKCKKPIKNGQYIEAMGKKWHVNHFTCAHCGKPFKNNIFYVKDGKPYCKQDYDRLFRKKCSICGRYIEGYYLVNFWGDTYCQIHEKNLHPCFNCGRLISKKLTNGGVRYADGRYCCNLCRPKVINEDEVNRRVFPRIISLFNEYDLKMTSLIEGVRVWLVDLHEIRRHVSKRGKSSDDEITTGVIRKSVKIETQNVYKNGRFVGVQQVEKKKIHAILVLYGLTEIFVSGVIAHELGHAFMFMHDFPELPSLVEEGMAEIFAFLWYRSRRGPEVDYRLHLMNSNTNPIYGSGFKAARKYMSRRGFWALLNHVKRHGRFPS
ncbi:MAG: protein DA1 [Promethearchaeota archaeon]